MGEQLTVTILDNPGYAGPAMLLAPSDLEKLGLDSGSLAFLSRRRVPVKSSPSIDVGYAFAPPQLGLRRHDRVTINSTRPPSTEMHPESVLSEGAKSDAPVQRLHFESGSLSDIGGLSTVIRQFRTFVELSLHFPGFLLERGIQPAVGVLLFGVPGIGKTLTARKMAAHMVVPLIEVRSDIFGPYVGETERGLTSAFKMAEQVGPSIILIDELESLAPSTRPRDGMVEHRVVGLLEQLLEQIKGKGVVVFACTNHIELIDQAVIRAGRFQFVIEMKAPDEQARLDILKIHTSNLPMASEVWLSELAALTDGFSGAQLESLSTRAAFRALNRALREQGVETEHFDRPRITESELSRCHFEVAHDDLLSSIEMERRSAQAPNPEPR